MKRLSNTFRFWTNSGEGRTDAPSCLKQSWLELDGFTCRPGLAAIFSSDCICHFKRHLMELITFKRAGYGYSGRRGLLRVFSSVFPTARKILLVSQTDSGPLSTCDFGAKPLLVIPSSRIPGSCLCLPSQHPMTMLLVFYSSVSSPPQRPSYLYTRFLGRQQGSQWVPRNSKPIYR